MKRLMMIIFLFLFALPIFSEDLGDVADSDDEKPTKVEKTKEDGGLGDVSDDDKKDEEDNEEKEEDGDKEEKEVKFNLNGYVKVNIYSDQYENSYNTKKLQNANTGAITQLKFEGNITGKAHFFSIFNLGYNQYDGTADEHAKLTPRMVEAYVDLYFNWLTIRAGHQIITWGKTDGFMVPTDRINPRDYTYLSSEYEDLKLGVTSLALNMFFSGQKFEVIWIPTFEPNVLSSNALITKTEVEKKIENSSIAVQLSGTLGKLDYALSYVFGFDLNPDFDNTTGIFTKHNRIHSPGLDFSIPVSAISIKGSGALFFTEDFEGEKILYKNSYGTYLLGIEYLKGSNMIGIQVGQKYVFKHKKATDATEIMLQKYLYEEDDIMNIFTGTINLNFLRGDALNLTLMFTATCNMDFENWNYAIQPVFTYKVTNGVEVVLGASFQDQLDLKRTTFMFETKYSF